MLVSFIIPSYNSAHTVRRCLDSIFLLPLNASEFEVIFVDDCSTDNTCDIVAEYLAQHPNIILLRQVQNNRQGAARNRALSITQGEIICFVDSDDAVTGSIVNAIRMAKERSVDMVVLHHAYVNENGITTREADKLSFAEESEFSGIEMQNRYPYWCSAPWGYIYKRDFLEHVNYPFAEWVLYEDSDFVAVHLYYAKRMAYFSDLGYKAYYREGSTTHSTSYKNVADYLMLGVRMMRFYDSVMSEGVRELENERSKFAEGILEGACWNVQKSCKRMIKLGTIDDVMAFYDRVDSYVDRKTLCDNRNLRQYYWNLWTSLCIGHKWMTMAILTLLIPIYKFVKK